MKKTILSGVLVLLLTTCIGFSEEINPKIKLVYGKWGDKPGEFGIIMDIDPEGRVGPNDFYVDENGFIYILDNANKRVQVFDKNGKFVRIDHQLYQQAEKKGKTRIHILSDGSTVEESTGLLIKEREEIFPNEKNYKVERKKEEKDGKKIYSTIITFPDGKKIEFSSNTNPMYMWGYLKGEDKQRNLYVSFSPGNGKEYIKISPEAKIVGRIFVYIYGTLHRYYDVLDRISSRGDIYIMNSDVDGFWIDCYPTELFDRPEGRDFTYLYEPTEEKKEGLKQLAIRLAKTTTGEMRRSAIMYLGRNKIKEVIPIIEDYLKREPDNKEIIDVQRTCLSALKEIGTEEAIEKIGKYGLTHKDRLTRIEAAELLINTKAESKAIEVIREMIKESKIEKDVGEKLVYFGNWLRSNGKKEAIEIWIELLKVPKAYKLAKEYLEESTGQDFGEIPPIVSKKMIEEYIKKWEDWWEKNKDTFKFPEKKN